MSEYRYLRGLLVCFAVVHYEEVAIRTANTTFRYVLERARVSQSTPNTHFTAAN